MMSFEEVYYETENINEVIENCLKDKLTVAAFGEIEIVNHKLVKRSYIDVAFYFKQLETPPQVFYTHLYYVDLLRFL